MISSTLTPFVSKRLQALETVDQVAFPSDALADITDMGAQRPSLKGALQQETLQVLFEIKKASPSLGQLIDVDALDLCGRYVEQGAKALSVLVDQVNFQGHPSDLQRCTQTFPELPFLHKDFVASAYQVRLARALGASSVLLMCQLLEPEELRELFALARELGLEPFVEVHDAVELELALSFNPPIIGINSRDFKSEGMPVDLNTAPRVLAEVLGSSPWPKGTALVAQSGIFCREDVTTLQKACPKGLPHAVQIGSSLSQAGQIPAWLKELIEA